MFFSNYVSVGGKIILGAPYNMIDCIVLIMCVSI